MGDRCDVYLPADVVAFAEAAIYEYGRVDIVMSNVGVIAKDTLGDPMEAWDSIIDMDL